MDTSVLREVLSTAGREASPSSACSGPDPALWGWPLDGWILSLMPGEGLTLVPAPLKGFMSANEESTWTWVGMATPILDAGKTEAQA